MLNVLIFCCRALMAIGSFAEQMAECELYGCNQTKVVYT